jgi:hypothetical protein
MRIVLIFQPMRKLQIVSRVAAGVLGGWSFTWGFVMLGIALALAAGMPYADAQTLLYLVAFLVYLVVFCWSFAAASTARVWLVLLGGGAAMTGLGWWMTRLPAV